MTLRDDIKQNLKINYIHKKKKNLNPKPAEEGTNEDQNRDE